MKYIFILMNIVGYIICILAVLAMVSGTVTRGVQSPVYYILFTVIAVIGFAVGRVGANGIAKIKNTENEKH